MRIARVGMAIVASIACIMASLTLPHLSYAAAGEKGIQASATSGENATAAPAGAAWTTVTVDAAEGTDIYNDLQYALDEAHQYATAEAPYKVEVTAKNYLLSDTLDIYSNTWLCLDKDAKLTKTVENDAGLMMRCGNPSDAPSSGYAGYANITVSGGTWDANGGADGMSADVSTMKFGHADNISVTGVTFLDNRGAHHLELGGVSNVTVEGCTFKGQYGNIDAGGQEAIQLDIIHDINIFAGFENYDDTLCENVTIQGNTFSGLNRGVGSHAAALGGYYQHMVIKDNTFTDISQYAVLAVNFKHAAISSNTMTNVGYGVDLKYFDNNIYAHNNGVDPENDPDADIEVSGNSIAIGSQAGQSAYAIRLYGLDNSSAKSPMNRNFAIGGVTVKENTISCTEGGKCNGILAYDAQGCTILGNTVDLASTSGTDFDTSGIFLQGASCSNTISGNTVTNANHYGIAAVAGSNSNVIDGNTVTSTGLYGIQVFDAGGSNTVKGNTVVASVQHGISVTGSPKTKLESNKVSSSGQNGINITASAEVSAKSNEVFANGRDGIGLSEGSTATLDSNTIYSNTRNGIMVNGASYATVAGGSIKDSGQHGLQAVSQSTAIISDCAITGPKSDGVVSTDRSAVTVERCTIEKPSRYGANATGASSITMENSTVSGSGAYGIEVFGSSTAALTSVTVAGSSRDGVMANSNSTVTMTGGSITGSGNDGIHVTASSSATVAGCTISKSARHGIMVTGNSKAAIDAAKISGSGYGTSVGTDIRVFGIHVSSDDGSTATISQSGICTFSGNRDGNIHFNGKSVDSVYQLASPSPVYGKLFRTSAQVTWGMVAGAEGYQVVRQDATGALKAIGTTTALSKSDATPTDGRAYRYYVRAYMAYAGSTVYGYMGDGAAIGKWTSLEGKDRYTTMAEIIAEGFSKADTVIVCTGKNFPDALAASALSGSLGAPIVLTNPDSLSAEAESAITSLHASRVVIIGGIGAVDTVVETALGRVPGVSKVIRIAGASRTETAVKVYAEGASRCGASWSGECCIITTGKNFADALSISPFAFANKTPIFLTNNDGVLDTGTAAAINEAGFKKVIIVGGTEVVLDAVKSQVATGAQFTRLAGANRYETSAAIARWSAGQTTSGTGISFAANAISGAKLLSFSAVALATGDNFPDALAGSSLIGSKDGVLLLVDKSASGGICTSTLLPQNNDAFDHGYFLGGDNCIAPALRASVEESVG